MAIVISSRIKAVVGLVIVVIGVVLGLIVGSVVGWFDNQDRPPGDLPYMPYRDSALRNRVLHGKQVSAE